jgi:membrane-anchored protein YejM (alkaline phosphatase superfamily)
MASPPRSAYRSALCPFAVINLVGFLLQGHRFAMLTSGKGAIPHILVWLAMLAVFATLAAAIGSLLHALCRFEFGLGALPLAAPLLFAITHVFLFVDATLYSLFHFHFNGLALDVLLTPGGFQTLEIPSRELIRFTVACVALVACEILVFQFLARHPLRTPPAGTCPGGWKRWLVAWIVVVGADRALGAVADFADVTDAIPACVVVPLYPPFAVKQIITTMMGWPQSSDRMLLAAGQKLGRKLNYPRAPLVFEAPASLPNIVWIVIEGWRADVFDTKVTPEIARLGQESLTFTRNVGEATTRGSGYSASLPACMGRTGVRRSPFERGLSASGNPPAVGRHAHRRATPGSVRRI